jgi:Dolichyl-phosphate-mannose-protein mannosyltransferase
MKGVTLRWPPPSWTWGLAAAVLLGTYLRLDQFFAQVLIDDEWHAVHQMLQRTPDAMFLDFGFADYSIPLGIIDWWEARWFGLSETSMRAPMLACGLVTLIVLPLYVAGRLSGATAAIFALLLAISPLLVIYSRMARPYAITLLLTWIAHAAFQRYRAAPRGNVGAGAVYGVAAAFAIWLHPIVAPFALAPLLWEVWELRRAAPDARRQRFTRLFVLALPTGALIAALVLPPLISNPRSLTAKGGVDTPNFETLVGVWYAWLGTPSSLVVVVCLAFAAYGAREVWRALPEARTGTLGVLLTLSAVLLTRPMWSFYPVTLARYLLPFVPLLLLAVAEGAVRAARRVARPPTALRRLLAGGIGVLPCVALAVQSPLPDLLRQPNAETLHFAYHFDFRPEKNAYVHNMERIPLSPFWSGLAALPAGSVRIAAAPFYFESYNWDAPRWERLGRQTVLPGYLTGLCVDSHAGEVPRDRAFHFENAVHIADDEELARHHIDYVVWQKPYVRITEGRSETIGTDTAQCEAALRAKLGPPAFEDSALVAFRVSQARAPTHAPR